MKKSMSLAMLLIVVISNISYSQFIKNIKAIQDGDKIQITYDLIDAENKDFFVRAYASNDGGKNFNIGIANAKGDVNMMVKSGVQRKIDWDALGELGEYSGMMRFKIIGLSNTALGKSENKDFIMGIIDIKNIAKDKVLLSVSLFCKSPINTFFSDKAFLVDNYGNTYKLVGGIIGNQTFSNKQSFAANELKYGELNFQIAKVNLSYTGGAPTDFQVRLSYDEGNGSLYIAKVAVPQNK